MRGSKKDLPVIVEMPQGKAWHAEWGGQTVEFATFKQAIDPGPLYKGLPDNSCQCPHWGYVIKGRMRYRYKDHEEVFNAGDAYYAAPGHTPVFEAGLEYVEFSPTDELMKTMKVVERNTKKLK